MKILGTLMGVGMAASFMIMLVIMPLIYVARFAYNLPRLMKAQKNRSLAPLGPYHGSTLGRVLKYGVLICLAADGNYMAIIVLWMLDHWER